MAGGLGEITARAAREVKETRDAPPFKDIERTFCESPPIR
jgi:hypothetical protein